VLTHWCCVVWGVRVYWNENTCCGYKQRNW